MTNDQNSPANKQDLDVLTRSLLRKIDVAANVIKKRIAVLQFITRAQFVLIVLLSLMMRLYWQRSQNEYVRGYGDGFKKGIDTAKAIIHETTNRRINQEDTR